MLQSGGNRKIKERESRPSLWPTQPHIQLVPGVISLGVKRPEYEDDHSPSSAEVKNGDAIPPLPLCLHGIVLN
jgi:hypothetical protein